MANKKLKKSSTKIKALRCERGKNRLNVSSAEKMLNNNLKKNYLL